MTAQETSIATAVGGKKPHRWSRREDDTIRAMTAEGATDAQIAERLGLERMQVKSHRRHLGLDANYARKWDADKSRQLAQLINDGHTYAQAAEILGVSVFSAKNHGTGSLGLKSPYHWQECEEQFLREHHGKAKQQWIATRLGKSVGAVANKARAMGLYANITQNG